MMTLASLNQRRLFIVFLVLSLGCGAVMAALGEPLFTEAAPNGIVSFELAFSVDSSRAMLHSWDTTARLYASCLQGLDYLYLCLYSTFLAIGCLRAAEAFRLRGWRVASIGLSLAWLQWVAALFDMIENVPLILMIFAGDAWSPLPQISAIAAAVKFFLVVCGLLYTVIGLGVRAIQKND